MAKRITAIVAMTILILLLFAWFSWSGSPEEDVVMPLNKTFSFMVPIESQEQKAVFEELAADYMAQNEPLEIRLSFVPRQDYWKTIYLNYSQQSLPDMMLMNNTMIPAFHQLGILRNVNGLVSRTRMKTTIPAKLLNNAMANGDYYGVPFSCVTYALFCNVDLLEKYGCTPPQTWEDLRSVCAQLTREPADSLGIAAAPGEELSNQFLQFLYANNATIRTLRSDEAKETYQLFSDLIGDRRIARDCVNWERTDLAKKFATRNVVMIVGDSSLVPYLEEQDLKFSWTATPIPTNGQSVPLFSCDSLVLTKDAASADVYSFLEFASSREQVAKRMDRMGSLSVRSDVEQSLFAESGKYGMFAGQYQSAQSIPLLVLWQNTSQALQDSTIALFRKEESIEQIIQNTYDLVNTYIIDG